MNHHLAKTGGSVISAIGRGVAEVGGHVVGIINRVGTVVRKNQHFVDNVSALVNAGATVGALAGLISPDTHARVHKITAQSRSKDSNKEDKSGGWVDFDSL